MSTEYLSAYIILRVHLQKYLKTISSVSIHFKWTSIAAGMIWSITSL